MKLSVTAGGFALYKESDVIGQCSVTPAPKGADIASLSILPQWRRKGYGSYLLKEILRRFGGYDREAATVFTAPLPADEGEGLFWKKFGFVPEGGRLCRRRTPDLTAVRLVQDYLAAHLPHAALCIDATCGNGGDTAFLCRLVGPEGRVLGFDIQPEAIASTRAQLETQGLAAELFCDSHANLLHHVRPGTADIVMFNFGWLPGADHRVFSTAESSIPALEAALTALRPGGGVTAKVHRAQHQPDGQRQQIRRQRQRAAAGEPVFQSLHCALTSIGIGAKPASVTRYKSVSPLCAAASLSVNKSA